VHEGIKMFYGTDYGISVASSQDAGTVFTLMLGSKRNMRITAGDSGIEL
jgi:hypothetical protein